MLISLQGIAITFFPNLKLETQTQLVYMQPEVMFSLIVMEKKYKRL